MNSWRLTDKIGIENACLLMAGLDPWVTDPASGLLGTAPSDMNAINMAAVTTDQPDKIQAARAWLFRARQAVVGGKLKPLGQLRLWGSDGYWSPVEPAEVTKDELDRLDFDTSRNALHAWLLGAGYEKAELPEFLKGADQIEAQDKPLAPRKRNSYLKVIAGLLRAQGFDCESERKHSLAARLQTHIQLHGIDVNTKTLVNIIEELKEL